MNKKYNRR